MSFNNVGHLITSTITTLQHFATLYHTSSNYTSLHLSTLHFLSFTLHYSPVWLNPFTFPIVLFHPSSLNQTQYCSHIPKLNSKVMTPFTALKNFSPFHFVSLYIYLFIFVHFSYQPFTSLYFAIPIYNSHSFTSLAFIFYFLSPSLPPLFCTFLTLVYSFLNLGARCGRQSTPQPGRFNLGKETRYPLYFRLGGPQGGSGRMWKISSSPGFGPRHFQTLASSNTHCALPPNGLYHRVGIRKHLHHVLDLLSVKSQVIAQ